MKKFFALLKADIVSSLTFSKNRRMRIFGILGIAAAIAVSCYLLSKLAVFLFTLKLPAGFPQINVAALTMNGIIFAALIYLFLGSFSFVLSKLYLSSDNDLLLSMPVDERTVFSARFVSVVFDESLYLVALVYPFFIGYGIVSHLNFVYYALSFLFTVTLPVVPFALAVFILMPLAEKFSAKKLQNAMIVIYMVSGFVFYFITQIFNPSLGILKNAKFNSLARTLNGTLKFLPSNVGYLFAESFGKGNYFYGIIVLILFVAFSAFLFYLTVLFARGRYGEGVVNALRTESVKVKFREEGNVPFLNPKVRALLFKDIKLLLRDARLKTAVFMNLAYIVFFLFAFVFMPLNGKQAKEFSFDAVFLPLMLFAITDFMVSFQSGAALFFADRRSVWVLLMSKVKPAEFFWSKFIIPFVLGEAVNIVLFAVSLIVLGQDNAKVLLLSIPVMLFFPFLLTSFSLAMSALFPDFSVPKNPRKLISGKIALVGVILDFLSIGAAMGLGFLGTFLAKTKGFSFTLVVLFAIVAVVTFAVSFPLIALAINRIKKFEFV